MVWKPTSFYIPLRWCHATTSCQIEPNVALPRKEYANSNSLHFPDHQSGISVFHRDFYLVLLFEDSPQLQSTSDTKRNSRSPLPKRHFLDVGQVTDLPSRRLFLRRTGLQHLVHVRNHHKVHRHAHHTYLPQVATQLDRFRGNFELLLRHVTPALFQGHGERWYSRVFLHHQNPEVVQANQTLSRTQDPDPHFQGKQQRTHSPRVFPYPWHGGLCQPSLLCWETPR